LRAVAYAAFHQATQCQRGVIGEGIDDNSRVVAPRQPGYRIRNVVDTGQDVIGKAIRISTHATFP